MLIHKKEREKEREKVKPNQFSISQNNQKRDV